MITGINKIHGTARLGDAAGLRPAIDLVPEASTRIKSAYLFGDLDDASNRRNATSLPRGPCPGHQQPAGARMSSYMSSKMADYVKGRLSSAELVAAAKARYGIHD